MSSAGIVLTPRPPQGGAGGGMLIETGRFERCPQCGLEFSDAVSLVEHVERQHASSNTSTCVVS